MDVIRHNDLLVYFNFFPDLLRMYQFLFYNVPSVMQRYGYSIVSGRPAGRPYGLAEYVLPIV